MLHLTGFLPKIWRKVLDFFPDLDTNFPDYFQHFVKSFTWSKHEMKIVAFFRWKSHFFNFMIIRILKKVSGFFWINNKVPWIFLTTLFFQVFPDFPGWWEPCLNIFYLKTNLSYHILFTSCLKTIRQKIRKKKVLKNKTPIKFHCS